MLTVKTQSAAAGPIRIDALDTLAYASLWAFVLTLPWSEGISFLGQTGIGTWMGMLAAGVGAMRFCLRRSTRNLSPAHWWMLAFATWAAASLLWSIDSDSTLVRTATYAQLTIAAWLIWDVAREESRIHGLLTAYVLGAGAASVSTIVNYWSGVSAGDFKRGAGGTIWDQNRYTIAGFNANDLGLALSLALPIAVYLLARKRVSGWTWLLLPVLGLCVIAILLTGSRGAVLAVAAGLLLFPFMLASMRWPRRLACLALIAGVAVASVLLIPEGTFRRYMGMFSEIREASLTHRTLIWSAGMDVFRDNPWLGTGAGTYGAAVLDAIDVPYVAHNTFLSVLVETGVIGALLFGAVLASLGFVALRMRGPERHLWLAALITWSVGVSALTWEYRKPTWFLFGMIAAQAAARRDPMRLAPRSVARETDVPLATFARTTKIYD